MVYKFPIAHWMYKKYPTAKVDKLIPRMRYEILDRDIKVKGGPEWKRLMFGKQIRLENIGRSVTDLIRDERVELSYFRAWEVRNFTERLIMEAIRNGDCHRQTMELADFYLYEKNLIHKLFKVLVPRYVNYSESFTELHLLPLPVEKTLNKPDEKTGHNDTKLNQSCVLELKGNPLPSVRNRPINSRNFLTNVLIRGAQKEYYQRKGDNVSKQ